jgi:hypothetical protein
VTSLVLFTSVLPTQTISSGDFHAIQRCVAGSKSCPLLETVVTSPVFHNYCIYKESSTADPLG